MRVSRFLWTARLRVAHRVTAVVSAQAPSAQDAALSGTKSNGSGESRRGLRARAQLAAGTAGSRRHPDRGVRADCRSTGGR